MAIQKVSLAFLINEEQEKELIGVFTCVKNALSAVRDQYLLMATIEDNTSTLEIYSMENNSWFDLDEASLEFSSLEETDRIRLFA